MKLWTAMLTGIDADGFYGVQRSGFGGEQDALSPDRLYHAYGFMGRCLDPDDKGNGAVVAVSEAGTRENHAWLLDDRRVTVTLPALQKGESLQYGPAGNFVRCHADGSITAFTTTDGTLNGKSVYSQVRPDGFVMVAPWGRVTFDDTGFHMLHSSGARIDAGAIGGLPAPLDQLASYAKIAAASVQIEASLVAIGTAAGASDPAARSTPTVAALTSIAAALTSIQAALVALAATGTALTKIAANIVAEPASATAVAATTASGVLVVAAATNIAATPVTIPSSTTVT